jgi:2'-5' RNA ligase
MSELRSYFLALEPDDDFQNCVLVYKRRIRDLVGDQLYLDDPPHTTLLVASFPSETELVVSVEKLAAQMQRLKVSVNGWHVFESDQLTGNNTLVCSFSQDSVQRLRSVQDTVIAAVMKFRDHQATRRRYREAWERLLEVERRNVEEVGYPFVGDIWHPHVTIASVRPQNWESVWKSVELDPPCEDFYLSHLALYTIDTEGPVLVERFVLESSR